MSMTDPIADFLTRLRNSLAARHPSVRMGGSRMKEDLARILEREGYIRGWTTTSDGPKRTLEVALKYGPAGDAAIRGLVRVSRPGRRSYCRADLIPSVLNGLGVSIVSTSQGVMSGPDARAKRLGGEVLCNVW